MSGKMKCFMFEETGEVMRGADGEWVRLAEIKTKGEYRCLESTEYSSNPLEPIREVWGRWTNTFAVLDSKNDKRIESPKRRRTILEIELWQAISECIAIMEGKQ